MAEPEPAPAGLADAVLLAPLTEDSFLHNLHVRYKRDIIYTYVGNALVSVNPCRPLPLYSAELVRTYLARPPYLLPPHLYAITATAYRWVRDRNENQCIVITGESGSGKTEAARVCLQCAVVAGGGGGGGALAAAGTLLEAFGNAATARNHNASRFGKLLDIEFDFKGEPVGGHITHYLLEKERVCCAAEGERNFHVLYQLLAGADAHLLKRLKLQRSWEQYRVLRGGTCSGASPRRAVLPPPGPRTPHADRDHFAFTKAAMGALGFSAGQCGAVLRVLAFLLKLGNVQFEPQHNIDGSIGTRLQHEYELREACALVGVDADELELALGAAPPSVPRDDPHGIECGSEAGSETEGAGAEWARALRDRLLCALYSRLFNWLVSAVNEALKPASVGARRSLGILDVYGLEALAHNGLERLLINYAAERVQAAVTAATLRREQEEYAREGLAWAPLVYADHEMYADLLDAGPESVLGILRDCTARGTGDAVFLQRLQRRRNPRLVVLPPDRFQVVHFGGAVMYSARGIVAKNRDAVCRRCAGALGAAREPLLAALFAPGASAAPPAGYDPAETASHPVVKYGNYISILISPGSSTGSPRRPCALSCRQRALVGALVRRLPAAPRLVRCLRADAALRPHRFDAALLRHQIRTQGIMDMAMLRRAGWCESMCARALLARYGLLRGRDAKASGPGAGPGSAPSSPGGAVSSGREDAVRAARGLLRSLPIPSAEFAYGRTKVFIRSPRTVWELEALRAARVSSLVCVAQRAWRRHRARTRARAAAIIARAWTRHRTREKRRAVEERRVSVARGVEGGGGTARAGLLVWRWWCSQARRAYLSSLWSRLPARHRSPACAAWPPCPQPRLLARADALLRRLHHRWRCHLYRRAFDQTARNRMREKVTASVLFKDRKLNYARSVAHPFVGDYVRLRASAAWRRGPGAGAADRYVVFADVVGKVARSSGRVSRCLAVVSTGALLLLEARSLRLKRRVPAHCVYRLSLSPFADDLLAVHVRACGGLESSVEELSQCSVREAADAPGCLFGGEGSWRRRGDVLVRTCHVLELATKLFLVVQNAVGSPPHVNIATEFEANFGQQMVTVAFHALSGGEAGARVLRRGSRMDVLL
ncbi:putative unconventional myosin 95e [Danaus plexippus plexippus]|uniref:Unconventional myosin 95e n=1 Tax=Danaus plexippus plexippus TaxID=278856 RepID=A0A212ELY4_DANPL|nr:putative unconventional myosin 95e [Danaus plexippus plexippus]